MLLCLAALSHSSSSSNFIKTPQEVLKWENRREWLLEEILRSGADIICLQEVDHFPDFFQPKLSEKGFGGVFKPKASSPCLKVDGNSGPDGCALFYKIDKFLCLEKQEIVLRDRNREETNQVAILIKFKKQNCDDSLTEFCVAVTHLKAKAEAVNIRTTQGAHLYDEMQKFCGDLPGIVCGDFNAQATELVYLNFKKKGWLESAYFTANGGEEPPFTSWKFRPGKRSKYTIDYIWYTVQLLKVDAVWSVPSEEEIGEDGLPAPTYPSDHVALCARFSF